MFVDSVFFKSVISIKFGIYVFKVGSVKFANSLSPPSIVKKVRTGSKSSEGT